MRRKNEVRQRTASKQKEHGLRRSCEQCIICLSQRLEVAAEERGVIEDGTISNGLSKKIFQSTKAMMDVHPSGSFVHIFCYSQTHASSLNDPRQMCWNPMMV